MGIDYSQPGSFPPQLGPDDSQVQQFLTAAKGASGKQVTVLQQLPTFDAARAETQKSVISWHQQWACLTYCQ